MRAGRIRQYVTIEVPTESAPDTYGQTTDTWSTISKVWAEIKPLRGEEKVQANQIHPETTVQVTMRAPEQTLAVLDSAVADSGNTGLDNVTSSGTYAGTTTRIYRIQIDGGDPTTPNTFKWSNDNGTTYQATGVAISGQVQALDLGVSIIFVTTTQHDTGDFWTIRALHFPAIQNTYRIVDEDSNVLNILDVIPDSRKRTLMLMCKEEI